MGREVRRVPLDFDWPMNKVWGGYITPERFHEDPCPDCERGWSPRGQYLFDLWYGKVPFRPEDNGSTPLRADTPGVRAFAERNIANAPEYYGTGEFAIVREAQRLADLFNGQWSYHLSQVDVDELVAADGLRDFTHAWNGDTRRLEKIEPPVTPTAAEVNERSLQGGFFHIDPYRSVRARCEREGVDDTCRTCEGHASLEKYPGQRAEAEAWEWTEPPTGDGWQLWETVSEGSPVSPVFATADELAHWMTLPEREWWRLSPDQASKFVAEGWAPTMAANENGVAVGEAWIGGALDPVTIPDDARDA